MLKKNEYSQESSFHALQEIGNFSIVASDSSIVLSDKKKYAQIHLSPAQKMQLNSFIQQVPQGMAASALAQSYTVRFPAGLPHTLSTLKQGGYGSMIYDGKGFVGSASFYPLTVQAAALGAFTVMSAVTGQYFLAQINSNLTIVNDKLDDVLSFLYGNKKSELLAEIDFVKYAYTNYGTIVMHEQQSIATISNLQATRKTAIQDIEFYLNDMKNYIDKGAKDYLELCGNSDNALKARECIEMAIQLYIMSGILELYYSQNYEKEYLDYIKKDTIRFINKCDKQITGLLGNLIGKHKSYKQEPFERIDNIIRDKKTEELNELLKRYQDENDSPLRIALNETLNTINQGTTYYLDRSGQVYVEIS